MPKVTCVANWPERRFLAFLSLQNSKFSSESQNIAEIECFRIKDRFRTAYKMVYCVHFCCLLKLVLLLCGPLQSPGTGVTAVCAPAVSWNWCYLLLCAFLYCLLELMLLWCAPLQSAGVTVVCASQSIGTAIYLCHSMQCNAMHR